MLPIKFWVRLESLSKKKAETYQQLPKFLTSREQRTEIVGELTNALPGATEVQLHEICAGKRGWCLGCSRAWQIVERLGEKGGRGV